MAPSKKKRMRAQTSREESPKEKKPKVEKVKDSPNNATPEELHGEPKPTFMSLNDDCCFGIFERLSLNSLCSVSQTCTRFQRLAADVLARRHNKVMIIDAVTDDGSLSIGPANQRYVKCFANQMANVTLDKVCTDKAALEKFSAMCKENRSSIKELRFENGTTGLNELHGSTIAIALQGVERVTFANMRIDGDLNRVMLNLMPNLTELTLWKVFNEPIDDDNINWMEQTYSSLKYFAWHLDREIPIDKLKRFLQANPSISNLSLLSKSQETIEKLFDKRIHVDQLFFDVPANVAAAFDALQRSCSQQLVKRLHLKFADSVRAHLCCNSNGLVTLAPYVEGLYFERNDIGPSLTKLITTFEHLKSLQCNISGKIDQLADIKKLEEVFVYWSVNYINFGAYLKALRSFASRSLHLKKIYLRNNSRQFANFEFGNLNGLRRKLANANKLKIFFKTDETKATGPFQFKREFDMIEPVRVETEIVNNPLINEYLTTIPLAQHFKDRFENSDYDSVSSGSFSGSDSDDYERYKDRKREARWMSRKYGRDWYKMF